jgi:hypothetical protein
MTPVDDVDETGRAHHAGGLAQQSQGFLTVKDVEEQARIL